MKKLKLNELNLGNDAEVLTREQLKKVLGGANSGGTTIPQTTDGNVCHQKGTDECSGSCQDSDGNDGSCVTAGSGFTECKCAVIQVGKPTPIGTESGS